MTYRRTIPVEFNHCDPAGIVFYPRYFEMTNSVIENFFAEVAGFSFARMVEEKHGVPTARIECDFTAPSRLGEKLDFALDIARLGRSAVTFDLAAHRGGELRLRAALTVVFVGQAGRPEPWPPDVRSRLAAFKGDTQ